MNSFQLLITRLAFQVDRKLLSAEEEDYLRLDLSGHERFSLPKIKVQKTKKKLVFKVQRHSVTSLKPAFVAVTQFAFVATLIFGGLFTVTNGAAYAKVFMANVQSAQEARIAAIPVIESQVFEVDPWTGEKSFEHAFFDQPLMAKEEAAVRPEDGILPLNLGVTSYTDWLRIPAINVNANLVEPELGLEALKAHDWNVLEEQIRETLLQGPVHYPGTAEPGQVGNSFITAHSSNVFWEPSPYNTTFALLPKLRPGDDIFITYNQEEFHYKVSSYKEVSPKDVSILEQGDKKLLTLMTCSPIGTNLRRWVVTAELIES